MEVVIDDTINKTVTEKVKVTIDNPQYSSYLNNSEKKVTVNDSLMVFPSTDQIVADFVVPDSALQGVYADMARVNAALLTEIGNREAAVLEQHTYTNDQNKQQMIDIATSYVGSPVGDAYILDSELSTKTVSYDADGIPTSSTLADQASKVITVGNNVAQQDSKILANTTQTGAQLARINSLSADSGANKAQIDELSMVAAGEFPVWKDCSVSPIGPEYVGSIIYTTDGPDYVNPPDCGINTSEHPFKKLDADSDTPPVAYQAWQYMGSLEPLNGGWRKIKNTEGALAVAKSMSTTNGYITGWQYENGGSVESSRFGIVASHFYVAAPNPAGGSFADYPFYIDSTGVSFRGKVTFSGVTGALTGTEYDNATLAADLASSTGKTVIDGGKIKTGEIQQVGYTPGDNTKNSHWNLETGEFVTHNSTGTFVLDSTATGTSPNIKGGIIDGATITSGSIDAHVDITAPTLYIDNLIVSTSTPGNFCNIINAQSTVVSVNLASTGDYYSSEIIIYSQTHGTNLIANRAKNGKTILLTGSSSFYGAYMSCINHVQVLDGSNWVTIGSGSFVYTGTIYDTTKFRLLSRVDSSLMGPLIENMTLTVTLVNT